MYILYLTFFGITCFSLGILAEKYRVKNNEKRKASDDNSGAEKGDAEKEKSTLK